MAKCEINQIFLGEIASVQNYGAFVRIPGCSQQGLIHKSQVSSTHVDDVSEILQRGERIWCKVISINEEGKIGLSMKHVNQGNGTDLDPNGVEIQRDLQRKKTMGSGQRQAIKLQAILNTTCTKCGTPGHLSHDCFMSADGKKYELIPEIEEKPEKPAITVQPIEEEQKIKVARKVKKTKKRKKSKKRSSDSDSDSDSESEEKEKLKKKKKKKKHSKSKKKKYSSSDSSDEDSDSSDASEKDVKTRKKKRSERHTKKCKYSKTRHPDR